MTPAQQAQQANRGTDGRYAEDHRPDPGGQLIVAEEDLIRTVTDGNEPLLTQLSYSTAASILAEQHSELAAQLTEWADRQHPATLLVRGSRSLYLVEGRIAEANRQRVAMWPKGLRARGFEFAAEQIAYAEAGYSRSDHILSELTEAVRSSVPPLSSDLALDTLPGYNPDQHDGDEAPIAACYLMRHRQHSQEPFKDGLVFAAIASSHQSVFGYLWTPGSRDQQQSFVRTSEARIAAMSCRVSTYRSGSLTVADCARWPSDRASVYSTLR